MIDKNIAISSFVLLLSTSIFYSYNITQTVNYKQYEQAMSFVEQTLEEKTNYQSHHFQPCRHCGYELALSKDSNYCLQSDLHKILHPKTILEDISVFRDYSGKDMARNIMKKEFHDSLPSFDQVQPMRFDFRYKLPLTNNIVYPYAKNYFRTHRFGTQAGCLFQKYLHVPGQDEIALKTNQTTHFKNYLNQLKKLGKSAKCIDDAKYYKDTYRLWVAQECKEFVDLIQTPEYKSLYKNKGIQHIYKNNNHLGNGIVLMDDIGQRNIIRDYRGGADCGRNSTGAIVQQYVTNPYLYKGHKMEFRAYFFIASTDPPIIYGYKKALIKQCALAFNLTDNTKQGHVCNTAVTKDIKEKKGVEDNEDDLYIDWNLEELQELLISQGRISDTQWLDKFLRPQIYRKIIHLYMSVRNEFYSDSRVSEFFGVDFIMDDDFRLWILECNRNPNFLAVTEGRKDKFWGLIHDVLELNMFYIRSKYQRIKKYLQSTLINSDKLTYEMRAEIIDLQRDRLEPEFQLNEDSNLVMIYVDHPDKDTYNYQDVLPRECDIA